MKTCFGEPATANFVPDLWEHSSRAGKSVEDYIDSPTQDAYTGIYAWCCALFISNVLFAIDILCYATRDHTGNFFLETSWRAQIHIWYTRYWWFALACEQALLGVGGGRGKEERACSQVRFACDVMAAMLVDRNNKIFLIWKFTAVFMQTLWTNFLLFCPPKLRQWKPPIQGYLYFLFITLFEIIPEIAFGKRHDPGQIIIVEDKKTNRQEAFLNEHENF